MAAQMLLTIPDHGQFMHSIDPLTLYQVIPYNRQLETINVPVQKVATRPTPADTWTNLSTPISTRVHPNVMVVAVTSQAPLPANPTPPLPLGDISGIPNAVPIPVDPAIPVSDTPVSAPPDVPGGTVPEVPIQPMPGGGQYVATPSAPALPDIPEPTRHHKKPAHPDTEEHPQHKKKGK